MPLTEDVRQTIGSRIKERRNALGIPQRKLAELSGLHPNYIAQFEVGNKQPNLQHLSKLCEALQTTSTELLGF